MNSLMMYNYEFNYNYTDDQISFFLTVYRKRILFDLKFFQMVCWNAIFGYIIRKLSHFEAVQISLYSYTRQLKNAQLMLGILEKNWKSIMYINRSNIDLRLVSMDVKQTKIMKANQRFKCKDLTTKVNYISNDVIML